MTVQTDSQLTSNVISVGVRELKDHLSSYLRQVKEGKTIEITEHGKPVCRIVPQKQSLEEKLEAMRKAGSIQWSGERFDPGEPVGENLGEKQLSDIVSELRDDDYLS